MNYVLYAGKIENLSCTGEVHLLRQRLQLLLVLLTENLQLIVVAVGALLQRQQGRF